MCECAQQRPVDITGKNRRVAGHAISSSFATSLTNIGETRYDFTCRDGRADQGHYRKGHYLFPDADFCEGIHFYNHGEWELALDSVFFTLKAVSKDVPIDL
jgi:hypothetical protein